jgi:hypothetical protein
MIGMHLVSVFSRRITTFPSNIVEEAVYSPSFVFGTVDKKKKDGHSYVDLYLGALFYTTGLPVCFWPVPFCFYCYCFIIYFEVGYCDTASIALFSEYYLVYLQSPVFSNELWGIFFNLCEECHWDFDGNCIKHVDCFS